MPYARILGTFDLTVQNTKRTVRVCSGAVADMHIDKRDIVALARGGYGQILSIQQNRRGEGERMRKWAESIWKNRRLSLAEALETSETTKVAIVDARVNRRARVVRRIAEASRNSIWGGISPIMALLTACLIQKNTYSRRNLGVLNSSNEQQINSCIMFYPDIFANLPERAVVTDAPAGVASSLGAPPNHLILKK
ncbi:hypothetical protein ACLOJK_012731 [Asimina triloba]